MNTSGGGQEQWAETAMFTASEVEAQTGVPAATLRQWERRYGFPRPERNSSGYRLYSPQDIRAIGVMQQHQQRGVSAQRAAELTVRGMGMATAGQPRAPQPAQERPPERPRLPAHTPELAHALAQALIAADHVQAGDLLAEAHARLPLEDVLVSVMSPALVEIGERWARGEITIAHERGASHFLRSRLSALMDIAGNEAGQQDGGVGPLVVAACAPGEQHELGLMMLTLAVRRRGVRVAYLGANVPLDDLSIFAHQRGAQAILLAVNGDWALQDSDLNAVNGRATPVIGGTVNGIPVAEPSRMTETMKNGASTVSTQPPLARLGLPVFLGGALMNARPELAAELGGIYAGPDAPTAASIISGALSHLPGTGPSF
ncbi:MerR family transcriptional regulator [Deinococcus arenicola]|uniref:MerR family transcriptional regulator n=1 Tax=Deinococcus arenicola TaxID=2994950 RepID=A0ABU4DQY2_9DEIO|nr:MerR family transcriptional regulator [Deinococcus sp. ZS9-10]MDV6374846.1 MerR family transcriptional regulator [Deinococcus sp. ZS9-10]